MFRSLLLSCGFVASALLAAPQAIVFDFGGVLTGEARREVVVQFLRESFQLSEEEFKAVNQQKRLTNQQGKTDEEFWLSYAKTRNISLAPDWSGSFQTVLKEAIGINFRIFDLVEELRERQIPVALLSNIDSRRAQIIRDFGLYRPFDPCLLSCEIGIEKPDPKAYEVLLSKLNLAAKEVVFIDDLPENIAAAKKVGLDAILFESEEKLREELRQRGVFPR